MISLPAITQSDLFAKPLFPILVKLSKEEAIEIIDGQAYHFIISIYFHNN
jgi:hypothetical protein